MAVVHMQKVAIVAHHHQREALIAMLHEEGVLEITPTGQGLHIDHTEVQYKEAEVQFCIDTLKNFADKQTQAACAKLVKIEDILHATSNTDVRGIIDLLHALEQQDTEASRALQEARDLRATLAPWKSLRERLSPDSESGTVVRILGTLPVTAEKKLRDCLTQSTPRSIFEKISGEEGGIGSYLVIVWKRDVLAFEELATSLGWTSVQLPQLGVTVAMALEDTLVEERKQHELLETNHKKREKLSVELPHLLHVRTFMRWLHQKQFARESMAATDSTITLLGWIPSNAFAILEMKLNKVSAAITILKVKADSDETPPVLLHNSKLLTPFESVTMLYGLPLPSEMDPTRALSPFFILYFALCLTDAGYGAVIALIFGTYLLITRKSIEEAKLIWLLFFGGIVTFIVSIPFGGWFGFSPEQAPAFLTKMTEGGLMFRGQLWHLGRQSGIDFLQYLALTLGITHLFFGMLLAGMHKWIHGKKAAAFWMDFTSHLLLGAVILYALRPTPFSLYTLYGAIAILVWGKGYGAPIMLRPLFGLLGLMNFTIGMISNGLSYLRILALGLVTGAIASAVNQVAVEIGKLFPVWIGIPVIILIFLGGHTVSIALNTLGSFIHSGRLQFIEFFSQFFEGGGRNFSPFRRSIIS